MSIIEPRVLKGFRDFLPEQEILRSALIEKLTDAFKRCGFVPIDTPVLEYEEILLGKGGGETEKQVYRFTDHGGRAVAMRFDLTVPFARFMALHAHELYLPFKRYHIAKVWRGENTQRGRYREFMQCDFDMVGSDTAASDFEIVYTIYTALSNLAIPAFTINLNHRGIFNRFLASQGILDRSVEILRTVDKLEKIGRDATHEQLAELTNPALADKLLAFIELKGDNLTILSGMTQLAGGEADDTKRIRAILDLAQASGFEQSLRLNPSITRGLDYYTGVVFETFINAMPEIGSICSGGRYNDLASLYTKQHIPGVGASVGLDRLIAALEALEVKVPVSGYCQALILNLNDTLLTDYVCCAKSLRDAGIACEVYPETKKIQLQFTYAEKKAIPFAIIRGETEHEKNIWVLKNLDTRNSVDYTSLEALVQAFAQTNMQRNS
ncbi:MAG TPA: histidine--tRNA ligase [Spirochaetia bacterium]|nr:histidine--tRNA ligase [Spirochaetales bacterium]HPD80330.1 histidine--tRNA ligase [Spirochaetales bacterium]HRS64593.1 histidine--tRNA ligase [Spirochaetia bacterium]